MKAVVTGGGGFLGGAVVRLLRARRDSVRSFTRTRYPWLDELGDPYTRTGADLDGRASIEWGVYGVPETFVVDAGGIIRHKHIGAVTIAR